MAVTLSSQVPSNPRSDCLCFGVCSERQCVREGYLRTVRRKLSSPGACGYNHERNPCQDLTETAQTVVSAEQWMAFPRGADSQRPEKGR